MPSGVFEPPSLYSKNLYFIAFSSYNFSKFLIILRNFGIIRSSSKWRVFTRNSTKNGSFYWYFAKNLTFFLNIDFSIKSSIFQIFEEHSAPQKLIAGGFGYPIYQLFCRYCIFRRQFFRKGLSRCSAPFRAKTFYCSYIKKCFQKLNKKNSISFTELFA